MRVIGGTVYVPVVNVGTSDVMLFLRRVLGTLVRVHVSSPVGVTEVRSDVVSVSSQDIQAAVSSMS